MTDERTFDAQQISEIGKEIYTHDGILLKYSSGPIASEEGTSGQLLLVEYFPHKLYIEWRPADNFLITDSDSQEQDWSLVDTISKRHRTASESVVFNTSPSPGGSVSTKQKPHLKVALDDLGFIEITARGQNIVLVQKSDGVPCSEFLFQNGNPDSFVGVLRNLHVVEKMRNHGNVYEVLDSDAEKLHKTFAELEIDEIKSSGSWISNIVRRNMDFLAKVSEFVPHAQYSSQPSPLSPTRGEDYEVLHTEKHDPGKGTQNGASGVDRIEPPHFSLADRIIKRRGCALSEKEWLEFRTEDGRISDSARVKEIIFNGGIEHKIRAEVWKYLLKYDLWDETTEQRKQRRLRKSSEYYQMKAMWLSMSATQERNFSGYRERKCQIEKDVKRTDRSLEYFAGEENENLAILQEILMTYVMYNFDLGYVQGMSDLLAPLLAVLQSESEAFWCFVGFMDLVFSNFDIDQAGMKKQLKQLNTLMKFTLRPLYEYLESHDSENMYFCFRWLLVWFKREFSTVDIMQLWETLWSGLPCPNYHLIVCLAILEDQVATIVDNQFEFNEILKHVNELSMKLDVIHTLELADAIYNQIKKSENLNDEIRTIIGEPIVGSENDSIDHQELEDYFDDLVNEPTAEELEIRRRKLDEACEQSMYYSFL